MDKNVTELNTGNDSGEYKLKAICYSVVYTIESASHLPKLDYLVSWKSYSKKENIWELYSIIQHLRKFVSLFYKNHFDKPTAISETINTAPLIAKPTVKQTKQKQG